MSDLLHAAHPWWFLSDAECNALRIGQGARRTKDGVLFGSGGNFRIEVVARREDAPFKLGPIALRLWGDARDPQGRRILLETLQRLHARAGRDFSPERMALPGDAPSPERPHARATVVDLPSLCDRACTFCGVSLTPYGERRPHGRDEDAERAISEAPGSILITGNDALSHPRIVELVALAALGGREVVVIGPPRAGRVTQLAPRLAEAGLARYQTGLFGPDAAAHDAVAGKDGAFAAVVEACAAMAAAGIPVELVTPLIRPTLPRLGAIATRARALSGKNVVLLAYAPDLSVGLFMDALVPSFDDLLAALATLGDEDPCRVDALPLCVLPPRFREGAGARLDRTDPGLLPIYPTAICDECALRPACPGVVGTVLRAVGSRGLVPLQARPRG